MYWLESISIGRDYVCIPDEYKEEYEDMYGYIRYEDGRLERKRLVDMSNELGVVRESDGITYKCVNDKLIKLLELVDGLESINPNEFDNETSVSNTEFYTVYKGNRVVFNFWILQKLDDLGIFWECNPWSNMGTRPMSLLDIYLIISKCGLNLLEYDVYVSSMKKLYKVEINDEIVSLITKVGVLRG